MPGVMAIRTGAGLSYVETIGVSHPGYTRPTLPGAFILSFWMCIHGLIARGIMAAICRFFAKDNVDKPHPMVTLMRLDHPATDILVMFPIIFVVLPPLCTQDGEETRDKTPGTR